MIRALAIVTSLALAACASKQAETLNPLVDYRQTGRVVRDESGKTERSGAVQAAFRSKYPCPTTKQSTGACPGWAIDHVIPLACGGSDAVYNLQWLPNTIKSAKGPDSKDHFERKIYGRQGASKGCP